MPQISIEMAQDEGQKEVRETAVDLSTEPQIESRTFMLASDAEKYSQALGTHLLSHYE